MCGIVGFFGKEKNFNILKAMLEIQAYRGPDHSGMYFDEDTSFHLGHNRLAIQDLSENGNQPFISDCGNLIIAFNGEVYNFNSIRQELIELGFDFISHSDTEVILYSYKAWGIECVHKFIGMFAFAILDKIKHKIFLVRDRAGVKPLYYFIKDNDFMFSSEIKSFHEHPKFNAQENLDVLPYYFQFGYIPAPFTIFKDCFKLTAGNYLEFDLDSMSIVIKKYWDVNDFYTKKISNKKEEDVLYELEEILTDSINLRTISDVPVGVFLSGGYDSSLVSAILSKKLGKVINTFTIGFSNRDYNEALHAKEISNYLGTNHTEYYIKEDDILPLVQKLPFFYDEPFGDSSAIPTMLVSKIAKNDVKVVLSADGGDESFCGYSKYFFLNKVKGIFSNKFKQYLMRQGLNIISAEYIDKINRVLPSYIKQTNVKDKYSKFKRAMFSDTLPDMFKNASSYVDHNVVNKFINLPTDVNLTPKWDDLENVDLLNRMMAIDYKLFMCDDVLTKVDRATMSCSIEGRDPLLDHRIIEYVANVPLSIKYKNDKGKYLLREILYKFIPQDLMDKPKSGFQVPLNEWLRGILRPLVEKYINVRSLDPNVFHCSEVNKIKEDFFNGSDNGTLVWFILMYQMWKEQWSKE